MSSRCRRPSGRTTPACSSASPTRLNSMLLYARRLFILKPSCQSARRPPPFLPPVDTCRSPDTRHALPTPPPVLSPRRHVSGRYERWTSCFPPSPSSTSLAPSLRPPSPRSTSPLRRPHRPNCSSSYSRSLPLLHLPILSYAAPSPAAASHRYLRCYAARSSRWSAPICAGISHHLPPSMPFHALLSRWSAPICAGISSLSMPFHALPCPSHTFPLAPICAGTSSHDASTMMHEEM